MSINHPAGLALILSGPSGVGKSTVCRNLFQMLPNARFSVSCATRAPRPGERPDLDYHFLTTEEFLARRDHGDFLEWAEVHGNYYGTLWSEILPVLENGGLIVLDIDVQGAATIRQNLQGTEWGKHFLSVFCGPPSFPELERRLRGRGTETEETILKRLGNAKREMARWQEYEYLVINDDAEACARQLAAIIQATALRTNLVMPPAWAREQEA